MIVAVVVAAFVVVADRVTLGYYAISPGQAEDVSGLVHVPAGLAHHVVGRVLLTDVELTQVTLLNALPNVLSSDTDLVPSAEVLGPYTPPAQLDAQGFLEMAQSQAAAKAVALTTLGYHVGSTDAGTLVFSVVPGSPASGALQVAQIVTAVDGRPTPTACTFVAALHDLAAGTRVRLAVEQSTVTPQAVLRPGPTVVRTVTLARPRPGTGASGCPGVEGPPRGFLGVSVETQEDFTYPFPVHVSTTEIGGPSAGLAMTLGIIDKLGGGRLTGGRAVAATGTIDPSGAVGDVSGVPQKTVAVEQAGATTFLVPPQELAAARSKATSTLRVLPVSSLRQALTDLVRLGGHLPPGALARAPAG